MRTMMNSMANSLAISRRGLVAGALSISVARADEAAHETTHMAADDVRGGGAWLSSLILQAATYAAPIVAMYNLRETTSVGPRVKVPPNEIWRIENIANPTIAEQAGYVTPNVNVLYGFGFMDLGQQPIIVSAPDSEGRYYMGEICDMWTNAFAYIGRIATGYRGGTFALVGPGWRGELPPGAKRIDCPTRWIELQPRAHVKNTTHLDRAQQLLRAITVKGLAQYNGWPAPAAVAYSYETPQINSKVASSQMQFLDPLQFWEIFLGGHERKP